MAVETVYKNKIENRLFLFCTYYEKGHATCA